MSDRRDFRLIGATTVMTTRTVASIFLWSGVVTVSNLRAAIVS